jgi:putative membrane protein
MMSGFGMMAGMGWLGILTLLLFWAGVLALVIWGISNLFPTPRLTTESDAVEIVRQRFARGEISREEYLQAVETLH